LLILNYSNQSSFYRVNCTKEFYFCSVSKLYKWALLLLRYTLTEALNFKKSNVSAAENEDEWRYDDDYYDKI
jgi:hypothetical protein